MWDIIASFIIRFRLLLIVIICLVTVVMGYYATKVEMSYDLARTVPADDPEMIFLQQFKKEFGEDANVIGIGLQDSAIFSLQNFNHFRELNKTIKGIPGVNNLLSLTELKIIRKDTVHKRFKVDAIFPKEIGSQPELDSLLIVLRTQRAYMWQLVNEKNGATMMVVSVRKEIMNSAKRVELTNELGKAGEAFSKTTGIKLHYGGLPYIRTIMATRVRQEMQFFLCLSVWVTGFIMLLFFRSVRAVLFSMVIIGIMLVCLMGTLALCLVKITLPNAYIAAVIISIRITKSVSSVSRRYVDTVI